MYSVTYNLCNLVTSRLNHYYTSVFQVNINYINYKLLDMV